jgi:hypothetical protein
MADDQTTSRKLEPFGRWCAHRGVTVRTGDRWVKDGVVEPPVRINNRKYMTEGTEPKFDKATTETT